MTFSQPSKTKPKVLGHSRTVKISPSKQASTPDPKKEFRLNRIFSSSFKKSDSKKSKNSSLVSNEIKLKNFAKSFGERGERSKLQEIASAPVNLLNQIRILIKAANLFRFRTKFRSLRYINEMQMGLLDDETNFQGKMRKDYYLKRFTEKSVRPFFSLF